MATTFGRCSNLDYCSVAASRRDVEVPLGEDFICAECGHALRPPPQKAGAGNRIVVAGVLGGGVVVLLCVGVYFGARFGAGGAAGSPAVAPRIVAAPPVVAPPVAAPIVAPIVAPIAVPAPVPPAQDVLIRLAGSDIVGATLAPELVSAFLAQAGDTDVKIMRGSSPGETLVVGAHNGRPEAIAIDDTPTAEAFARLGAGHADIVMAARQVNTAEHEALRGLGDMNTPAAEHVAGVDGLVLVANAQNRLRALTTEQVRGLLSGAITDWSAVGGAAGPVAIYTRTRGSETDAVIRQLALHGAAVSPTATDLPDDAQIAQAVSRDPRALGVLTLPPLMLHNRYAVQVRPLAIADTGSSPVAPSNRPAVATLDYPYAFRLYLYIGDSVTQPVAKRFVDFVDSRDGEAVADAQGLVSQSVAPQELILPDTVSNRFREFVAGAKLLAVHFRFQTNSTDLDISGQRDLDRVTNYLVANHYGGENLVLAGFADNQGAAAQNVALSQKRADALAVLLTQRGLKPGRVSGFGAELPLTDNGTEDGRQRNRRVEMYLLP